MSAARRRACRTPARQKGLTLIEVLIAAVILAIGVLGIVVLLTISKVSQHETIQRTRAVALADDILERIRRNPEGVSTYDDRGLASPLLGSVTFSDEPSPDCTSATCTAAQLATHDLWAWEQLLSGASVSVTDGSTTTPRAALRDVRGCIVFTPDAGRTNTGVVDVIVQWRGLNEGIDAATGGSICGADFATDEKPYRRQVTLFSYIIDETEL